ncbi:MAG: YihY/virulence factor BrkB family protein [Bacteroidetes bacterium]|nr:YihY/virulence factor BrkB family protein [Bacteroidota bacterium]MBU1372521.1 YihY/virulence factor BrkB family protein [Bacteroidota bacterium]MBU1485070.1 YihY/virulence factor BrkB family protein [Bacteroidota bacterium]MBU1759460.1 YihY/virulence factor BrkB family protein [Bacteroidota bacterium]MBU2374787.1 YihY/virulence factor BrkB family protein [Bacteroidota bacterium]
MTWLNKFLLRFRFYRHFIEWTKFIILPGFSPLPLHTVALFFFQEIKKDSLVNKASSLAYNFMMAIFPSIIFFFTLIPYIPIKNFQNQLMALISLLLPENAYLAFESTLEDIVKNQNGQLLSLGFVLALFFATNGIHTLMQAFNRSSLIVETRTWLRQRIVALNLTLLTLFSLIIGVTVLVIGEFVITFIKDELAFKDGKFWIYLIAITRWIIIIIVYFVTTSMLYRYGPANAKKWKFFNPGSWFATLLAVLTSIGFTYYINNFGAYNKLYGSIGTLLVVMLWLYLNSLILLVGFELNASLELSKRSIKIVKPRFNTFKDDTVDQVMMSKKKSP